MHYSGVNVTPSRVSPSKFIQITLINKELERLRERRVNITFKVGDEDIMVDINCWEDLKKACKGGASVTGITPASWIQTKYPTATSNHRLIKDGLLWLVNSQPEATVQGQLRDHLHEYLVDTSRETHGFLSAACEAKQNDLSVKEPVTVHLNTARVDLIGRRSATLVELKCQTVVNVPDEADPKY